MPIDCTSSSAINPFQDKSAAYLRRVFRYTGPASYATGGELLTPGTYFGIGRVYVITGNVLSNGTLAILVWWNRSTSKLMAFDMAGVEIANGTDLSVYSAGLEAIGY